MESVKTGPYEIVNCGNDTQGVSMLVNTLISILQPVLNDVSQDRSSAAYTAFFKNIAFAPIVYDILSKITAGTPFPPGPHAVRDAPPELFGAPATPQLVCVTDYNQITWSTQAGGLGGEQADAYTACLQSPISAFSVFGTKYLKNSIVLCPDFWMYSPIPPLSKSACSVVDPHFNRFRDTGRRMINYQLWVILNELAHSYIYARSGSLIDVQNVNECVSLSARNAVKSARNYIFYAANIRLGCTDFPRGRRSSYATIPTGSVELMEVDANTTSNAGSGLQLGSPNGQQSIGNSSTAKFADLSNGIALAPWPT